MYFPAPGPSCARGPPRRRSRGRTRPGARPESRPGPGGSLRGGAEPEGGWDPDTGLVLGENLPQFDANVSEKGSDQPILQKFNANYYKILDYVIPVS